MKKLLAVVLLAASMPAMAMWSTLFLVGQGFSGGNQLCHYEGMGHKITLSMYGLCPLNIQYNSQTGEIRR
jgi:hypothetical protein